VGVIGTGSTGVQLIPVVARQAGHLSVFQRSPAYTLPWEVRAFEPGELDEMKSRYDEIRAAQRQHPVGAARLSAFSVLLEMLAKPPLKTATREQQLRAIEENGIVGALSWGDIFFDIEANQMAAQLYGEAVARIVTDPETAASLVPSHPFGCKRPIIDQGYYETFNRDNVELVDLRKGPIRAMTATGIDTEQGFYELDVIVYATGFDAMTGALTRIDIRGRDGISLRDFWADEGPYSYLGLAVAGFPNLFIVQAPGSPSAATNFVAALEQHVEWIGDCITHLRNHGYRTIEALPDAQREWIEHTTSLVAPTVLVHPTCNSWYNGGNVPGKKRMYMGYTAGIPEYRRRCDEIAAAGYTGFKLA
jgi:cyclohexanone monooxygenase